MVVVVVGVGVGVGGGGRSAGLVEFFNVYVYFYF